VLMNVGIGNIGDIIKNKYLYKENTILWIKHN
jgi:hypothetical protein